MSNDVFFNTQHSPIGAFASFTLGQKGARGGLGLEMGKPADENVFVGAESAEGNVFEALPFFGEKAGGRERYDVSPSSDSARVNNLRPWPDKDIRRELTPCRDTWRVNDFEFAIHSPAMPVPDPSKGPREAMKLALVPAVTAEITLDNRKGSRPRKVFFGYQGSGVHAGMRTFQCPDGVIGIAQGMNCAIASDSDNMHLAQGFTAADLLMTENEANLNHAIGAVAMLVGIVPAGKRCRFRFAICFHRAGDATSGMNTTYWYTKYFPNIESVARYTLGNFDRVHSRGEAFEKATSKARMDENQSFMFAQAVHSYYGSTEFLNAKGKPFWIVNEGEYRMMNTFDLTADHVFFEMALNPWTVRNELDWFANRFTYRDRVRFPGEQRTYPGGVSFPHDMGVANTVSPAGTSSYEQAGLTGCFSYMTHEELVNWVLCGLVYAVRSGDKVWAKKRSALFAACLQSMMRRDHPVPAQRNGLMGLDSDRCAGGAEITTYDSLDVSLGQARNNVYLAVKSWAAYVGMEDFFRRFGMEGDADRASKQASLCAASVAGALNSEGFIPAVIGEGVESRVIPAIEGLVFPHVMGLQECLSRRGRFGALILALETHLETILKPGICLFPNGGWKISSTSENSWLSKIYLCQFVATDVLQNLKKSDLATAHAVHASWLRDDPENAYWAWSDQVVSGKVKGSKYYPRGITSILWTGLLR